jgi:hypothetical protein
MIPARDEHETRGFFGAIFIQISISDSRKSFVMLPFFHKCRRKNARITLLRFIFFLSTSIAQHRCKVFFSSYLLYLHFISFTIQRIKQVK